MKPSPVAIYVASSSNSKLSRVSRRIVDTTYSAIKASCPASCPLRDSGCYAQTGTVAHTTRRLDRAAVASNAGPLEAAEAEARAIDSAYYGGNVPKGQALRLHTVGDCATVDAAKIVVSAVRRWKRRGGGSAWTYTHAWSTVPRRAWGPVSVLASVESVEDADTARARGYTPALVVDRFPEGGKVFAREGSAIRWLPCPAQVSDRVCSECRLCWGDKTLSEKGYGIAFAVHGSHAKRALTVLR